ncbi:MAG: hypothetical protein M1812_007302 [Candelaria pacifica]|nr:MAG: hypothetical protein M1812_007302 [Candelaria pacifica]
MLAHYPTTRQDHSPSAQYLSFPYTDLPSPSTSTRPFHFTNAYSTSTPSPSEHSSKHQRQQYFDFTRSTGGPELYDTTAFSAFGGYLSMPTPPYQLQNPPIRVQQSTPTPHLSREPSLAQNSMLLENPLSQNEWKAYEGTVGQLSPAALQHLQSPQRRGRGHQRASSGSSIGSAGPPSPYDQSISNPYIAHSDASSLSPSGYDSSYDDISSADQEPSTTFSKATSQPPHASFLAPAFQNYNPSTHSSESTLAAQMAMKQALMEQHGSVEDDVPGFSYSGQHSVSSLGHPSPATPSTSYGEQLPNLDRTMSDIYQDELYNPALPISAPQMPHGPSHNSNNSLLSPYRNIITERLQTANNNHLTTRSQSPSESGTRERSPFREGSRLAPVESKYAAQASSPSRLGTAAQMREQQKDEADSLALRQHQPSPADVTPPNTISPRDALLDYHESEEDTPLFPQSASSAQYSSGNYSNRDRRMRDSSLDLTSDNSDNQSYGNMASTGQQNPSGYSSTPAPTHTASNFTFVPPSVPGNIPVPSQYTFGSQQHRHGNSIRNTANDVDQTPEFPAHLTSMESSASDAGPEAFGDFNKPTRTMADSGTYTCTYHGCALRFETPAKLQKHKREGHRQTTPSVGGSGMTSAALMRNSQAGPHRCERINPSTGKPCSTIFSRPYDLTRHEDTIHNARKQKVRCHLCTEEKTFSRNDALTRHMRVVHPEVDFPGKTRRKNQD